MLRLKQGVDLNGIKPELLVGIRVAECVYEAHNYDLWLTSVNDGKHGRGSLHYVGLAFDCRIHQIPTGIVDQIVTTLKTYLNEQWDVVLEKTHIHIEYQPK